MRWREDDLTESRLGLRPVGVASRFSGFSLPSVQLVVRPATSQVEPGQVSAGSGAALFDTILDFAKRQRLIPVTTRSTDPANVGDDHLATQFEQTQLVGVQRPRLFPVRRQH